jgi:DNA-binding response OmpR family regulator
MAAADSSNNGSNRSRKILIVDDEPDITSTFDMILQMNGFEVNSYNDPLLALSNFKPDLYGLALIDIRMPKMNGFELYNQIRKIDDKVKVCFITAIEIQKDEHFSSITKSNDKYKPNIIRKPIEVDELVKRLKGIIPNS